MKLAMSRNAGPVMISIFLVPCGGPAQPNSHACKAFITGKGAFGRRLLLQISAVVQDAPQDHLTRLLPSRRSPPQFEAASKGLASSIGWALGLVAGART